MKPIAGRTFNRREFVQIAQLNQAMATQHLEWNAALAEELTDPLPSQS